MSSREAIVSLQLPEQKECFFPSLEDLADDGILFSLMTVHYTSQLATGPLLISSANFGG